MPAAYIPFRSVATLAVVAAGGLAMAGVGGCVTEVRPVNPKTAGTGSGPISPAPTAGAPQGAATTVSRIAAAIKPLGAVPYDGLTLPLVSTNGRYVVTQIGSIPPWESVLADRGAVPVPANAVAAFEVIDGVLRRVEWQSAPSADSPAAGATPAPPSAGAGLLLGRSIGEDWVLVERPNPDGSRWIGRLDLVSGAATWLVQGATVNAQALLLRDGTLVYSRRAVDQAASDLVLKLQGGDERTVRREGWRLCQPVATPDQSIVSVLAIGSTESELLAFSTTQNDQSGAPLLVGRSLLGPMSAAAAFQAVTPVEASPPDVQSELQSSILMVNADRRRLCIWDPIRGTNNVLPAGVMAAVRFQSPVASGLVMSSSRGTDLWAVGGGGGGVGAVPARLVGGSYIPRSYRAADGTRLMLLSPQTDSASPSMRVLAVELVAPKP